MEIFKEKDKDICAYLLICNDIKYEGNEPQGDVLFFKFSPADKAQNYSNLFLTKKTKPIQPKDFAEAQQTITDLIWRWRRSRDVYGGKNYNEGV